MKTRIPQFNDKIDENNMVTIKGQHTLRVLRNDGTKNCLRCFASIQGQWVADQTRNVGGTDERPLTCFSVGATIN